MKDFTPDPKPVKKAKSKLTFLRAVTLRKFSDKAKYSRDSKAWLKGKACECGCGSIANQVHHPRGREGYADNDKFLLGIKLLHDQDYWLPVCAHCHDKIERNPAWAYENGYSESRAKNVYE